MLRHKGRNLVVPFRPGRDPIPTQAVVQRQVGEQAPAVLGENTYILVPRIEGVELALVILARYADQVVGKVDTRFLTGENETAIELRYGRGIHLIGMNSPPNFTV